MREEEKINILLVDDQPGKLTSYEAVLSELGERLIKAGSAREALEQLLRNEIAVVLMDVCMPELDGFQLAAMIRDHPRFKDTAIVFISAVQLDDDDRLRGYQLGAVDYVPIPIIPDLLRAKVRVFAELYRKNRELELLNRELESRVAERTAQLEQTNGQLLLALEVARLGTWEWLLDAGTVSWSDECFRLLGYAPGEVEPSVAALAERVHPDDVAAVSSQFERAIGLAQPFHQVFRCLRCDGSVRWCEARSRIERDPVGKPVRMLGVVVDITEHKLAEERQRLMVQELHHRVKNSLATVQAIAGLTARTTVDVRSFHQSFCSRLESLSRTHTTLVTNNWQFINIGELLSSELGSFQDAAGERISYAGPAFELPSSIGLALGLAIHELMTNAVKYGALSVPQGRVDISWNVGAEDDGEPLLKLSWVERDGPPVSAPVHKGFGTTLLQKVFALQYGAQSELEYCRSGLRFSTAIPCNMRQSAAALL